MSFTHLIKIIKKFDDRHEKNYALFTDIIGKLQPIAFLISASLVLAVYYFNIDQKSISGIFALFASLLFFLAYLGFVWYKITNYRLAFYWGLILVVISVSLIYFSFREAFLRIISVENITINILVSYVLISIYFVIARFTLDNSNKEFLRYKICNTALYIITLIYIIYVPFAPYLNLIISPLLAIIIPLLVIISFVLIVIISNTIPISKKFLNRLHGDISEDFSYQ